MIPLVRRFIATDLIQSHGQTITSRRDDLLVACVVALKMPAPSPLAVHAFQCWAQDCGIILSEVEAAALVNRILAAEQIGHKE